ncbi:amino acid/polyamine transporter I [Stachybotrys elegans]|uniref:Amino acid/polyamine transporter I n=1 Tax=Stachybotrys elegans TaxID=80388 RepID=A0A8K0T7G9_9HYPO|nr:amino acid/polyamine transporter I [Stachybotrys elegans]
MGKDMMEKKTPESMPDKEEENLAVAQHGARVNASGHVDQLKRQYGLLGLAGTAITVNNAWVVLSSSISVSLLNGGPAGLIYGLITAVFYYSFIGLSLSELASAFPTSGGVYHWASLAAGPKWGRAVGFFAGWINFYGWMFGLASLVQVCANSAVQLYATYNPDFAPAAWHVYIAYLLILWVSTAAVILANRQIPYTQKLGMVLVIVGGLVTIGVITGVPSEHASNQFVWGSFDENNLTGWDNGVAFMIGVLNGAFTIGTPDAITHMAEEAKVPERDLPRAIMLQISVGGLYGLAVAIALGYAIVDLSVLQSGGVNAFPLAGIYQQATQSRGATFGLLFIIFISSFCCVIGTVLTNSRTYWALARDNAVPLSHIFQRVSQSLSCPVESTLFVAVVASGLGAIPIGSSIGFSNLTGSFIIISTISYAIPMACNLLTRRKYITPGPFHLGRYGFLVNGLTVLFIAVFDVFFCFPLALPFDSTTMNYNCVILAGVLIITTVWWFLHATKHYPGPIFNDLYLHDDRSVDRSN